MRSIMKYFCLSLFFFVFIIAFSNSYASASNISILGDADIPDPALKAALEELVGHAGLSASDLHSLSGKVDLSSRGIQDPTGLSYLENVSEIDLSDNDIYAFDQSYLRGVPKDINLSGNEGLSRIKDTAFSGAASLRSLILPGSVVSIGAEAFMNSSSLERIEAPGVREIKRFAFFGVNGLEQATFPSLVSLGDAAFAQCSSLSNVSFSNLEAIGASAFTRCTKLQNAALISALSIGDYAFQSCISLKSVELNSVNSIGISCFWGCNELERIDFSYPCPLLQVGHNAFPDQQMRLRFIDTYVETPASRSPDIPSAIIASVGRPNWSLFHSSDPSRIRFTPGTQNLNLLMPPDAISESYSVSLVIPTDRAISFEFIFELWPEGSSAERSNAIVKSDVLPSSLKDDDIDFNVPVTGESAKNNSEPHSVLFSAICIIFIAISLYFLWRNRSML